MMSSTIHINDTMLAKKVNSSSVNSVAVYVVLDCQ